MRCFSSSRTHSLAATSKGWTKKKGEKKESKRKKIKKPGGKMASDSESTSALNTRWQKKCWLPSQPYSRASCKNKKDKKISLIQRLASFSLIKKISLIQSYSASFKKDKKISLIVLEGVCLTQRLQQMCILCSHTLSVCLTQLSHTGDTWSSAHTHLVCKHSI